RTGEDRRTFLYHQGPGHWARRVRGQIRDPGPRWRLSAAQSGGARHLGRTGAARAASCRGRAPGMTGPRILLVEDDRALREALADTLMLGGYDYLEAADGEQALALLQRHSVAMVVSDVNMPGMDGHALLRALRERYPQLPVLLKIGRASCRERV